MKYLTDSYSQNLTDSVQKITYFPRKKPVYFSEGEVSNIW